MNPTSFDHSYLAEDHSDLGYPEQLLHDGRYFRTFKVMIDRKIYIYKKCKPESAEHLVHDALMREFEIAQELHHPHIQHYLSIAHDVNGPVLIKEYIPGTSLDKWNLAEPQEKKMILVIRQMIDALRYLHSKGITHGDIKPQNIVIHEHTGDAYLLDFGHAVSPKRIPATGGTPGFLLNDSSMDDFVSRTNADIYALCQTLLRCPKGLNDRILSKIEFLAQNLNSGRSESLSTLEEYIHDSSRPRHFTYILGILLSLLMITGFFFAQRRPTMRDPDLLSPSPQTENRIVKDSVSATLTTITKPSPSKTTSIPSDRARDSSRIAQIGREFFEDLKDSLKVYPEINRRSFLHLRTMLIVEHYDRWQASPLRNEMLNGEYGYTADNWYQYGYWKAFSESNDFLPRDLE